MVYSPQSNIHCTKLNILNKTSFSLLIRSVPQNILTDLLLIYSLFELLEIAYQNLYTIFKMTILDVNKTALILSTPL